MRCCLFCKSPIQIGLHGPLCERCRSQLLERAVGSRIQPLLELFIPAEDIIELKQTLSSTFNFNCDESIFTDKLLSLGHQVKNKQEFWRENKNRAKKYFDSKPTWSTTHVFLSVIIMTIVGKRHFRRYIRQRFNFDPIKNKRYKVKPLPVYSMKDMVIFYEANINYLILESIFNRTAEIFLEKRDIKDDDVDEIIEKVIRDAEFALSLYGPLVARGIKSSSRSVQLEAILSISGLARNEINLELNKRLRRRLSEDGINPNDKLLEELPSNTFQAYQDTDCSNLKSLIQKITNLLEHNGSERKTKEEFTDDLYQYNLAEPISLDPAHQLELEDLLNFARQQAGLTDYEETVSLLKGEGYEDKEIAEQLDRPVGGVKQAWLRAKKKLSKIVNE